MCAFVGERNWFLSVLPARYKGWYLKFGYYRCLALFLNTYSPTFRWIMLLSKRYPTTQIRILEFSASLPWQIYFSNLGSLCNYIFIENYVYKFEVFLKKQELDKNKQCCCLQTIIIPKFRGYTAYRFSNSLKIILFSAMITTWGECV